MTLININAIWAQAGKTLISFSLLLAVFAADPGRMIERARNGAFDLMQRLAPRQELDASVLMIDIDDASLAQVGQWPWPRSILARLVDKAHDAGAAVIAFDVIFSEPDRTSPRSMVDLWATTSALHAETAQALRALPDHDDIFAGVIRRSDITVLGLALASSSGERPPVKAGMVTIGDDPRRFLPSAGGAVAPLPALADAASGIGSVSFPSDPDFILRRLPIVMRSGNELVPSLATEAVRIATGAGAIQVKSTGASGEIAGGHERGIVSVRIGPLIVPTDVSGRLILHYAPSRPDLVISAADLLDGKVEPARLEGAILFVGTSAAGLRDIRPSPLDPLMPGVQAHIQAVQQMLASHYLYRPDWLGGAEGVAALVLAGLAAVAVSRLRPLAASLLSGGAIGCVIAAVWIAYTQQGWLLDPVVPSAGVALLYAVGTVDGFVRTEKDKRRIRSAFGQYLSPALVARLAERRSELRLGGETRETTVLFCDIRGFTPLSEAYSADPAGLTRLINRFLTPMTGEVLAASGTIDKYMGDALMAFWNAPLDDPDHAPHAVAAVLRMRAALEALNVSLGGEMLPGTDVPVRFAFGIGVNTGAGLVGNVGSDQRFNYSVMGDIVNLASRLEGQCKTYGVDTVLGEATVEAAPAFTFLELDLIAVKGKKVPVRIYTLLGDAAWGADPAHAVWLEHHRTMMDAYRAGDFAKAAEALAQARVLSVPSCAALYGVYAQRLTDLATVTPLDWDGVYRAESK